jgi:hypothetical protein
VDTRCVIYRAGLGANSQHPGASGAHSGGWHGNVVGALCPVRYLCRNPSPLQQGARALGATLRQEQALPQSQVRWSEGSFRPYKLRGKVVGNLEERSPIGDLFTNSVSRPFNYLLARLAALCGPESPNVGAADRWAGGTSPCPRTNAPAPLCAVRGGV